MDRRYLIFLAVVVVGFALGMSLSGFMGDIFLQTEIISEDPELESFSGSQDVDLGPDATWEDLPFHTNFSKEGPWHIVGWRYVPAELMDGREEGVLTLKPLGEPPQTADSNVLQYTTLPNSSTIKIVMKVRNAADFLDADVEGCTDSKAFLFIGEWSGPENLSEGNAVPGTLWQTEEVIGTDMTKMEMDISNYSGTKTVWGGGVTTEDTECGAWNFEDIAVEELYIEASE